MVNTQLLALLFLMWYVVDGKDGCCWVSSFWDTVRGQAVFKRYDT